MRILQVLYFYGSAGGSENYIFDFTTALEQKGHSCIIVYGAKGLQDFHVEGRPEYYIPELLNGVFRKSKAAEKSLKAILEKERPDLAYVHTFMNAHAAELLVERLPTVFFAHTHDLYCPAGSKHLQASDRVCPYQAGAVCFLQAFLEHCQTQKPLAMAANYLRMKHMQRWARLVDLIVVDAQHMKERLMATGYQADRIVVLPTPIKIPNTLRQKQATPSTPLVLFAGRLTPQKGLCYLLKAMRFSRIPYRLLVAGAGYSAARYGTLVRRLGLSTRVDFMGWVSREQLDDLYEMSSVVVVPSVWPEPFGMVGPEAMGHGKPVVAFNVGGIPEWLEHGVTGFLVKHKDIRDLAERIDQLLANPELAQRMGMAGRTAALKLYGMENHFNQLIQLLERIIFQRAETSKVYS